MGSDALNGPLQCILNHKSARIANHCRTCLPPDSAEHPHPSRPYSTAGEIRVMRSHLSDRSKWRDQNFSIASVCVVVMQFRRTSKAFICTVFQFRSQFFPHLEFSRNSRMLGLRLGTMYFRSHIGSQKAQPRSIAHPFTENRGLIQDRGPQPTRTPTPTK